MSVEYPWYSEVADGSLDQGDILPQCPAGYLPLDWNPKKAEQQFVIDTFDLIVLTQACDLVHDKTDYVVCCPVSSHSEVDAEHSEQGAKQIRNQKEMIRKGIVPRYAMIAAHNGNPPRPVSIVDFALVFSLPKAFLEEITKSRHLRLLSPYREHVSQGFARFFMRVGLPTEIPSFLA